MKLYLLGACVRNLDPRVHLITFFSNMGGVGVGGPKHTDLIQQKLFEVKMASNLPKFEWCQLWKTS